MIYVIKNPDGSYSLNDNGVITNNLKGNLDKRKGCRDIQIPANSLGENSPKTISESKFKDGITQIEILPKNSTNSVAKAVSGSVAPSRKSETDWLNFVLDEDKETLAGIKERAEAKKSEADAILNAVLLQKQLQRIPAEILAAALLKIQEEAEAEAKAEKTE